MSLSKQRFVTVCQQLLTTGAVLAVGVTAAGVLRLDIVTPSPSAQAETSVPQGAQTQVEQRDEAAKQRRTSKPAQVSDPAPVEEKVVEPKVREVAVLPEPAPKASATPAPKARKAPAARATEPAPAPKGPVTVTSAPQKVTGYATVGVTWANGTEVREDQIKIQVRSLTNGVWSEWTTAEYHDDHAPDAVSGEGARTRPGTDALVIGEADQVQVRAESATGTLPSDTKLAIIDPGLGTQKASAPAIATKAASTGKATLSSSAGPIQLSAMNTSPAPKIYSRAQWGANESLRDKSSLRYGTVKGGFVHHTVNANDYTSAQVPALIRGIYAYHTRSRGWSDIGYNFLVDRFGRIWEGRYGGVTRNPMGAHTLGYNDVSFAMSAIGNFETAQPSSAMLESYAKLMAWKLSMANIRANGKVTMHGKTFNAISGHRDAGSTACPGRNLYAKLASIRTRAAQIQAGATTAPDPTPTAYNPLTTPTASVAQAAMTQPKGHSFAGSAQPDLVVGTSDGRLTTLVTSGITSFNAPRVVGSQWSGYRATWPVGDVTGDGRPDFINPLSNGYAGVWSTTSSGSVAWVSGSKTGRLKGFAQVAGVGDVTGDRIADVVGVRAGSKGLFLLPGQGRGRFAPARLISSTWGASIAKLHTVGQVVGSSHADMIFENKSGELRLAPGLGNGRFGGSVKLPKVAGGRFVGYGPVETTGRKDLIFTVGNTVHALPGLGSGRFSSAAFGPVRVPAGISRVSAVNMTGSAQNDIVGLNSAGRLVVAAHSGGVNFRRVTATPSPVTPASAILNVGDWNGDGHNDIITRHAAGDQLILRPGRGDGTFGKGVTMSRGWARLTQLTAVGDVTGDRRPDLVGRLPGGGVRIFPGNGSTSFQAPRWAPWRLTTFGQMGAAAWHPREVPDSIITSADGRFVPVGGAASGATPRVRVDRASYDVVVGAGDFDRDGSTDIIGRDKSDGRLWLLKGDSRGAVIDRIYLGSGFNGFSAIG